MKERENEIVYDGPIEAVDRFAKEFDGINQPQGQEAIQEVWESGIQGEDIEETQAKDMKNWSDS
jgi:hypothetical protein